MKVRWTEPAEADLDVLVLHIAKDNVEAALHMEQRILAAVGRLERYPRSGRPGEVEGSRELVVARTPYLAIYRITDAVEVVRILHGAQQWPPAQ